MVTPKVSVYITNFNYGKYLKESIESVLSQSYKDFELIIIDDGSSDNSKDILASYENNPNIADCRNLDNDKPIHLIDYHELNRPYIDYEKSIPNNYVWRNFKPVPGEIYFSDREKIEAKKTHYTK